MDAAMQMSFEPLTPVSFLDRSAHVFGDRLAVVSGEREFTYAEHWDRTRRQAGLWASMGVRPGDRVAVLSPNTHVLLEAHVGVPLAGAVLVALNARLHPAEIAGILEHSGTSVLLVDHELRETAEQAVADTSAPVRVLVAGGPEDAYERLLAEAPPHGVPVSDERALLSLNYTSGTTGIPKGVMYHHRGAYLQALAMAYHARLDADSQYLWTLPMFNTNGWCFPWAVTAAGAVHHCLRRVDPQQIWEAIIQRGITHLAAAPVVLSAIEAHPGRPDSTPRTVRVHRRCSALARSAPAHRGHRDRRHPSVRPDRDVRSRGDLRVAQRMGRAATRTPGGTQGPTGGSQRRVADAPRRRRTG